MQAICLIIGGLMAVSGVALAGRLLPCIACSLLGWTRAEKFFCDLLMTSDLSLRGADGLVWLLLQVPFGLLLAAVGSILLHRGFQ